MAEHRTRQAFARGPRFRALSTLVVVLAVLACACACSAEDPAVKVPVKDSVDAYSWDELSALSARIAAADDAERMEVAKRYGLVNGDGALDGTQEKRVELADGTVARVLVAGFCQDTLVDGGMAGISFIFADAVAVRPMNNDAGNASESMPVAIYGGWNACEARSWLNAEFTKLLPPDLEARLRVVAKTSTAVPTGASGTDSVDEGQFSSAPSALLETSQDRVWLPACCEVAEVSDLGSGEDGAEDAVEWLALYQQEGARYQLFADTDGGAALKARRWWLRSINGSSFSEVMKDGAVEYEGRSAPGSAQGLVPCFAL